jgi:mRNA interferase RelE/StbE
VPKYEIVWRPAARRAIETELPLKFAEAAVALIVGPIANNPRRLGKPLEGEMSGEYSACLGEYRIVYRIVDAEIIIFVIDIRHRAHVYAARLKTKPKN